MFVINRKDRSDVIGDIYSRDLFFLNGTYHPCIVNCKVVYTYGDNSFDEFQDLLFWNHFLEDKWVGGWRR